mmetsp:Transcript_63704/g.156765  ORF Transcript_63704/g.156765 Transcript_63704/m.156765 type:complete len:291 (-) Transcript_63704:419-1291(-)
MHGGAHLAGAQPIGRLTLGALLDGRRREIGIDPPPPVRVSVAAAVVARQRNDGVSEEESTERDPQDDSDEEPHIERHGDEHQRVVEEHRHKSEARPHGVLAQLHRRAGQHVTACSPREAHNAALARLTAPVLRHVGAGPNGVPVGAEEGLLLACAQGLDEGVDDADEEDYDEGEGVAPRVARDPALEQHVIVEARVEVHAHDAEATLRVDRLKGPPLRRLPAEGREAHRPESAHLVPAVAVRHVVVQADPADRLQRVRARREGQTRAALALDHVRHLPAQRHHILRAVHR